MLQVLISVSLVPLLLEAYQTDWCSPKKKKDSKISQVFAALHSLHDNTFYNLKVGTNTSFTCLFLPFFVRVKGYFQVCVSFHAFPASFLWQSSNRCLVRCLEATQNVTFLTETCFSTNAGNLKEVRRKWQVQILSDRNYILNKWALNVLFHMKMLKISSYSRYDFVGKFGAKLTQKVSNPLKHHSEIRNPSSRCHFICSKIPPVWL